METTLHRSKLYVLLVDDDPVFCKLMESAADRMNISILSCQNLSEIRELALSGVFDAAIVDYHLDGARSDLKGPAIAQHLKKTPTILISHNDESLLAPGVWPHSIKKFVNKRAGPEKILKAAVKLKRLLV